MMMVFLTVHKEMFLLGAKQKTRLCLNVIALVVSRLSR